MTERAPYSTSGFAKLVVAAACAGLVLGVALMLVGADGVHGSWLMAVAPAVLLVARWAVWGDPSAPSDGPIPQRSASCTRNREGLMVKPKISSVRAASSARVTEKHWVLVV